jgi:hypothetical protein
VVTKLNHRLRRGSENVPVILRISKLKDLIRKS